MPPRFLTMWRARGRNIMAAPAPGPDRQKHVTATLVPRCHDLSEDAFAVEVFLEQASIETLLGRDNGMY